MTRLGIVGCGLIGAKRAAALPAGTLAGVCDVVAERARKLATAYPGAVACEDWRELAARPDIDAVVVATTHDLLAPIGLECLKRGKHVLLEKPGARNADEFEPLVKASAEKRLILKVGFNHRYHPAVLKAKAMVDSGEVGPLMMIRGRYGHGGRPGYESEWRAKPEISGGGELLDQGMHLIDLANWFMGGIAESWGRAETLYWKMPVDDNAFLFLKGPTGVPAWLHVSWTEWKNVFSLEIYGKTGKLIIEGLGGSYGQERLFFYKMGDISRIPDLHTQEFAGHDDSWRLETQNFMEAIAGRNVACGDGRDAFAALQVVKSIYTGRGR